MQLRHPATPAQALYRIFISPSLSRSTPVTSHLLQPKRFPITHLQQRRTLYKYRKVTAEAPTSLFNDPSHPVNEAIKSPVVHLSDAGKLTSNQSLANLLSEARLRNRKIATNPDADKGDKVYVRQHALHGDGAPVVRFVTEKQLWEQQRQQKTRVKTVEDKSKQLELNWALDQKGDLQHRLARLREFLGEGRRVEILLATKKGGRRATLLEAEALLAQLREAAASVPGAEEVKPMEGKLGGACTLHFGVKAGGGVQSAKAQTQNGEGEVDEKEDKKAKKEREREERRVKEAERQRKAEERARELEKQRSVKVEDM